MDLHTQRLGHGLNALQANAGVACRFVALDLLFLEPETRGELFLGQASRDPRADQGVG